MTTLNYIVVCDVFSSHHVVQHAQVRLKLQLADSPLASWHPTTSMRDHLPDLALHISTRNKKLSWWKASADSSNLILACLDKVEQVVEGFLNCFSKSHQAMVVQNHYLLSARQAHTHTHTCVLYVFALADLQHTSLSLFWYANKLHVLCSYNVQNLHCMTSTFTDVLIL